MVVPTKSFTIISDADIDPDSPITTELMTFFRDNDIHLEEWLGGSFVAAIDHDHDGVNSASINAFDLLSAAVFDLTVSGGTGTTVATGALGFTPLFCIVIGTVVGAGGGGNDGLFTGFATGTGSSAKGASIEDGVGTAFGVDADAVGGAPSGTPGTTFGNDLDVTVFTSAGITFSITTTGTTTFTFKVLVFGA